MKKQNVKLTLLASLVTGLLSQGAMAGGTTIVFSADVVKTTCNVASQPNNGVISGVSTQELGNFTKDEIFTGVTKSASVGDGTYNLTPSTTAPLTLTVNGCSGDELASTGSELTLIARGTGALDTTTIDTANDLYGDPGVDHGFGFALGYQITDNSTGTARTNNGLTASETTGFIVPSKGGIPVYKAKQTGTSGDLGNMDVSVVIAPQIASWAGTSGAVKSGDLYSSVTFSVAMN
ncbi:hypothetical protein [Enterobacter ludwigii]|uniref:hypothetical protein n=1 Tax=Enterobacter ludwigii TaxID=299767 RepID=UPI001E4D97F8|nr:hypothetical protein [Enterobacter ludwigii]MCE1613485.1 hypothetical protein [Enterobacter ludwigii]MCE1626786.1 hypothetical protein [Enterobacter ludwigii]